MSSQLLKGDVRILITWLVALAVLIGYVATQTTIEWYHWVGLIIIISLASIPFLRSPSKKAK